MSSNAAKFTSDSSSDQLHSTFRTGIALVFLCALVSIGLFATFVTKPANPLLFSTLAGLEDGTDHECGSAEPCAVMSPSAGPSASAGARGMAHNHESKVHAGARRAPRKVHSSRTVAPETPTLVAADAVKVGA